MAARGRVKTMVPRARSTLDGHSRLKSNKEELHRFSCFYRSQFSSFAAYDRKTRPSKILPYDAYSPAYLIEYRDGVSSHRLKRLRHN